MTKLDKELRDLKMRQTELRTMMSDTVSELEG